ncbi:MAG TPA: hypothetical protein VH475_13450 [Tepidisphaeraceae bacterium]
MRTQGIDGIARILKETDPHKPSTRLGQIKSRQSQSSDGVPAPTPADPAARRGTDFRSLTRELRGDLDWIVMKAMEKDRSRRYETATGLAIDVRRYLQHEPVWARPPTTTYRLRKLIRRHRAAFAAALAVACSLILGMAATGVAMIRARNAERVAVAQQAQARREAEKATTVSQFLQDVLTDVQGIELLARAEKEVGVRFRGQPDLELQTRYTLFRAYSSLGLSELGIQELDRAWELVKASDARRTETGLRVAADLAYYARGTQEQREQFARETADLARDTLGDDHEVTILARNVRAVALVALRRADEAEPIYRRLIQQLRARGAGATEDANAAAPFSNLGALVRRQDKLAEARDLFEEGLRYANAARYNGFRNWWICSSGLAETLERQGELPKAADLYDQILTQLRSRLGPEHPSVGPTVDLYVSLLRRLGRNDDVAAVERGQWDALSRTADLTWSSPIVLARRAHARVCVGRFPEAIEDYRLLTDLEPAQHLHWYYLACVLAYLDDAPAFDRLRVRMLQGFGNSPDRYICLRLAKAAMLMPAADPQQQRIAGAMVDRAAAADPADKWLRISKALVEYRAGRFERAVDWCEKAQENPFGNPAADASVQLLLALAHHASGQDVQARAALARGRGQVARDVAPLESGRMSGVGIEDWLICHSLLREANGALPGN